nr:helix-turn-helix domain-containing protein [Pseudorhizobium flavum]
MFTDRRTFREIQASEEGISPKTLAERMSMLVDEGILVRSSDPGHSQRSILKLTQKGIDLLPVLADISVWSLKHLKVDPALADIARQAAANRDDFILRETSRLAERDLS